MNLNNAENSELDINVCPVCNGASNAFLVKNFKGQCGLDIVNYVKCIKCGFVWSPTIYELSEHTFVELNRTFHYYLTSTIDPDIDPNWQSRIENQSIELSRLYNERIISSYLPWLDYACGNGMLVRKLRNLGCDNIFGYEPYITLDTIDENNGIITEDNNLITDGYDCVISTSLMEDLRDLKVIDRMCELISSSGALIFHTYVGDVPQDADWFYLLPTHCSIFTNKAMKILFNKYGFKSAIHLKRGNMHVWSRMELSGFVKGEPAGYQPERITK